MIKHHITKYKSDGKQFACAWLRINLFGKEICFSTKTIEFEKGTTEVVIDSGELTKKMSGPMTSELNKLAAPNFSKEDFLETTKPYDFVAKAKDQFELEKRLTLVSANAVKVGVKNFRTIYKSYSRSNMGEPSSSR